MDNLFQKDYDLILECESEDELIEAITAWMNENTVPGTDQPWGIITP